MALDARLPSLDALRDREPRVWARNWHRYPDRLPGSRWYSNRQSRLRGRPHNQWAAAGLF